MENLKFLAIGFLFLNSSCQLVIAEGEMTFTPTNNWDYVGKIAPNLAPEIHKFDLLQDWVGDAKRMKAFKIENFRQRSPIYVINTTVGYPSTVRSMSFEGDRLYRPLCSMAGECGFLIYKQTEEGYSLIFNQQLVFTGDSGDFLTFSFSNTLFQGYPQCFEIKGYDRRRREGKQIPDPKLGYKLVSRYCYDGSSYQFNRIYQEKIHE